MITSTFEYHRPNTIAEAVGLLQRYGGEAKLLAGGHSLLPTMKMRLAEPQALIDLSRVGGLQGVRQEGDTLVIGGMTRHYQVLSSPVVQQLAPLVAETAAWIGDQQVRNRGTIGGSLSHADPGADLPAAVLATRATLRLAGPNGERTLTADEFFVDMMTTAAQPYEVLAEVRVPVQQAGQGGAYEKFPQPASRFAIAGVAALVTVQGGAITAAGVALTGASTKATRLTAVEQAITGRGADAIASAAEQAANGWDANDDLHASAEYRRHLATVLTRRALLRAVAVATGQGQPRFGQW